MHFSHPTPLVGRYVYTTSRSRLKTALPGTYHLIKFAEYGYCYLADVQFRFKRRYNVHSMIGMPAVCADRDAWASGAWDQVAHVHRQSGVVMTGNWRMAADTNCL